jgi:hypothetical protein
VVQAVVAEPVTVAQVLLVQQLNLLSQLIQELMDLEIQEEQQQEEIINQVEVAVEDQEPLVVQAVDLPDLLEELAELIQLLMVQLQFIMLVAVAVEADILAEVDVFQLQEDKVVVEPVEVLQLQELQVKLIQVEAEAEAANQTIQDLQAVKEL